MKKMSWIVGIGILVLVLSVLTLAYKPGESVFAAVGEPTASSAEQKVLDQFIGNWRTTYKMSKAVWTPEEKMGSSDHIFSRVLGCQFIQEQAQNTQSSSQLMYTYDQQQKCYRSWYFSSDGVANETSGTWNAETKTFTWTTLATNPLLQTVHHHFVNNDTFEWDTVIKDRNNVVLFLMEGKTTRVKG